MSIKYSFTSAEHTWLVDAKDPAGYFSNACKKVILLRASAAVSDAMNGMALMEVRHEGGELVFGFMDDEPFRSQEVFLNIKVESNFWGVNPHNEVSKDMLAIWLDDSQHINVPLRADVRAKLIDAWNGANRWLCDEASRKHLALN